jgi:hypothetical protein
MDYAVSWILVSARITYREDASKSLNTTDNIHTGFYKLENVSPHFAYWKRGSLEEGYCLARLCRSTYLTRVRNSTLHELLDGRR